MKKIILTIVLMTSAISQASTLLDCNISDGDTTQATVIKNEFTLTLKELSDSGHSFSRELTWTEWQSKRIKLMTKSSSAQSVLYFSRGTWWFQYTNGSYRGIGQAICD